jgi:hypothetical protein
MKKPAAPAGSDVLKTARPPIRVLFAGKMLLRRRNSPPGQGRVDFEAYRAVTPVPRAQPVRIRRLSAPTR